MINITNEELEKQIEKEKKEADFPNKYGAKIGSLIVPVSIVIFIILLFIHTNFLIRLLILVMIQLFLCLVIPFGLIFIKTIVSLRNANFGKLDISLIRASAKNKHLHEMVKDEICSDKLIEACDKTIASSDNEKYIYSIKGIKLNSLSLQCRFDEARAVLAERAALKDKCIQYRAEYLLSAIDLANSERDDDSFIKLLNEADDILECIKKRGLSGMYIILLFLSKREDCFGNYSKALEYIEMARKCREAKAENDASIYKNKPKPNLEKCIDAELLLDKAYVLCNLGDPSAAMEDVEDADLIISELSCDIPPLYTREHEEVMRLIKKNSAAIPTDTVDID